MTELPPLELPESCNTRLQLSALKAFRPQERVAHLCELLSKEVIDAVHLLLCEQAGNFLREVLGACQISAKRLLDDDSQPCFGLCTAVCNRELGTVLLDVTENIRIDGWWKREVKQSANGLCIGCRLEAVESLQQVGKA